MAEPMTGTRFADIPSLVGHVYVGEPFTVTRAERDAFEHVTWVDRAYPGPDAPEFPEDIVEGFHSLALLDAVSTMAQPFEPGTTAGYNYGLDRVRFTAPISIGDRVLSRFEIKEVRERGEGYTILRHCELTVEGAEGPAVVADWWVYVWPAASGVEAEPEPVERA
jgi:acyl dehydratase